MRNGWVAKGGHLRSGYFFFFFFLWGSFFFSLVCSSPHFINSSVLLVYDRTEHCFQEGFFPPLFFPLIFLQLINGSFLVEDCIEH